MTKIKLTVIADDEVGLIESIDGDAIPQGHIFARITDGHSAFQDGEAFLSAGGQKGPQVSNAESCAQQNAAIGGSGVAAIEIAKQISSGNIKITPDFLVQGGDGQGGLLSAFLAQLVVKGQRPEPPRT